MYGWFWNATKKLKRAITIYNTFIEYVNVFYTNDYSIQLLNLRLNVLLEKRSGYYWVGYIRRSL